MQEEIKTFPLDNSIFLEVLSNSFQEFIKSGTSRSTAKLKPLHGAIAQDLAERLGADYDVFSQGYKAGKEVKIKGRYIDKAVDITVKKGDQVVAGLSIKFVMQNYSQNSNNYFENMLGETANIRCGNCPYFQIFIILDKLPYYQRSGILSKWESFTEHNVQKYIMLSHDNADVYYHTPNKTLIYIVHIPENDNLCNNREYMDYYRSLNPSFTLTEHEYSHFGSSVILNDYELFIEKVYHTIKAL